MMTIKPTMPRIETGKQRRLRMKAVKRSLMTPKQKRDSHKRQQKEWLEAVGRYKDKKEERDLRYKEDIDYIESLTLDEIPTECQYKIGLVLRNHKDVFIKKTARLKSHAIRCIHFCRVQKQKESDAIEKILLELS